MARCCFIFEESIYWGWAEEMAQRLRALAALEEDLGSTHSTTWQLTAVYHSSFREFDTLTQIYVQAKHQHT
jgi:DNA-binding transcriptional regulator YbjK